MTSSHTTLLARGPRWQQKQTAGGKANTLRILAVAEGYAMVRYPYCQVWAIHENDLRKGYELLTDEEVSRG
jgi:hypothetical protein